MTGFEAISHHNGWVMAALGAVIVFIGLAVLAFVISLLPKIFALFEKEDAEGGEEFVPEKALPPEPPPAPGAFCTDPKALAKMIEPFATTLAQPFQLADLYRLCRENDLPHPHLSLSCLQRQGYLVFQGEGAFTWKSETVNTQEG